MKVHPFKEMNRTVEFFTPLPFLRILFCPVFLCDFGDVLAMNGYPNNFWGWGGEDDELFKRLKEVGLSSIAPPVGSIEVCAKMLSVKRNIERGMPEFTSNHM